MECCIDLSIMGAGLERTTFDETTVADLNVEGLPLFFRWQNKVRRRKTAFGNGVSCQRHLRSVLDLQSGL